MPLVIRSLGHPKFRVKPRIASHKHRGHRSKETRVVAVQGGKGRMGKEQIGSERRKGKDIRATGSAVETYGMFFLATFALEARAERLT
jgi:hypothetical protein